MKRVFFLLLEAMSRVFRPSASRKQKTRVKDYDNSYPLF